MRYVLFVVLVLLAHGALGETGKAVDARKVDPRQIGELIEVLGKEMDPGGRYGYIEPGERAQVESALAEMQRLIAGRSSLAQLREDERVALFNAQELANAILTERDNERRICERRSRIGTHRKETVCETYGERMARLDRTREEGRKLMDRQQLCAERTVGGILNSGDGGVTCF